MMIKKNYLLSAVIVMAIVVVLIPMFTLGKSIEVTMANEVTLWGNEYVQKHVEKTNAQAKITALDEELQQLACKALANRTVLCQRGDDSFCKEEQAARASMVVGFGAPFEQVCLKDFQVQVTAL